MNDSLLIKQTKHGKGVFATRDFSSGEIIIPFKGKLFTRAELPKHYDQVEDHYVQIGEDRYLGPSGDVDDFFNHSCVPNSGLVISGKKTSLGAIKKIDKGDEVTWDYSTTMAEDEWEMDCKCGSKQCRGRIRDFKYLPATIQKRYVKLGIVPKYVLKSCQSSMDEVIIVPSNPAWPFLFKREQKRLLNALDPQLIVGIEHFGSTAIPGLSAKPIIDVLIIVRSLARAKK